MKKKSGCGGASTVEAAVLFPLILILMIGGFFLMTRWYSQWEAGLKEHEKRTEQRETSEHLKILHWEQWGTLLEDQNE